MKVDVKLSDICPEVPIGIKYAITIPKKRGCFVEITDSRWGRELNDEDCYQKVQFSNSQKRFSNPKIDNLVIQAGNYYSTDAKQLISFNALFYINYLCKKLDEITFGREACKVAVMGGKSNLKKMLASDKTRSKKRLSVRKDASRPLRHGAAEVLLFSDEESFFRAIASNTPDHILMQDLELRYLLVVNPQLGLTEKNMIGKTDREILTKEDADNITKIKKQVIETDTPVRFEAPLIDREGNRQFFDGSYVPKHDILGCVDGIIGYFRNITEQKRAEEALKESEERFKAIALTTPVGIGVVDASNAVFLYVNPAYEKAFGYAESELLGRKTPDIYWSGEDREKILGILKEKAQVAEYKVKLKRQDGTMFWGLSSVRPIIFDGRPALLGAFVNITDRKNAEERLLQNTMELLRSNEELERFNRAMVGRELRMVELKKQVNELCVKLGEPPQYKTDGNE